MNAQCDPSEKEPLGLSKASGEKGHFYSLFCYRTSISNDWFTLVSTYKDKITNSHITCSNLGPENVIDMCLICSTHFIHSKTMSI